MLSTKSRKQRKQLFNAPLHKKRKWIAAHLEENLLLKYDRRNFQVIKGDTVRIMKGSFKDHEDKIVRVNVKKRYVEVEGVTLTKADGKRVAKPIHPSNVMITKLNLTDKWRRNTLEQGLSEETKKEIEKEAERQIEEIEEEKRKVAEEDKEIKVEKKVVENSDQQKKETKKPITNIRNEEETKKEISKELDVLSPQKKLKKPPKEIKKELTTSLSPEKEEKGKTVGKTEKKKKNRVKRETGKNDTQKSNKGESKI